MGFAAAITRQGRFAPTCVAGFTFDPEAERHIWQGKVATNAAELAEQVNGAIKSIAAFGDPWMTLEIVEVPGGEPETDKDAVIASLLAANAELRAIVERGPRKLQVLSDLRSNWSGPPVKSSEVAA